MLLEHYPSRLIASPEIAELETTLDGEVMALRQALYDFQAQLNIRSAIGGLKTWEQALGLTTDVSKSDMERRERIMSKLRGTGSVTAAMIANVAAAFTGGTVTVVEDAPNYKFTLRFSGQYGVPPNMDDVSAAIDEIKPAHLDYDYEYSYLLIRDIHDVMTLVELETQTLEKFAGGSGT